MRSPRTATKSGPCSLLLEKAHEREHRPNAAKIKKKKKRPSGGTSVRDGWEEAKEEEAEAIIPVAGDEDLKKSRAHVG